MMSLDAVIAAASRARAAAEAAVLTGAVRSLSRAPRVASAPVIAQVAPSTPKVKRRKSEEWPIPQTGTLSQPTGRMVARALHAIREKQRAVYATRDGEDGTSLVSLDGFPELRVTLRTQDYRRLLSEHRLTATRWLLEDGEVRAYRMKGRGLPDKEHTYSVAALILGAQDCDVIHLEDCLDLRPQRMRLDRQEGHEKPRRAMGPPSN